MAIKENIEQTSAFTVAGVLKALTKREEDTFMSIFYHVSSLTYFFHYMQRSRYFSSEVKISSQKLMFEKQWQMRRVCLIHDFVLLPCHVSSLTSFTLCNVRVNFGFIAFGDKMECKAPRDVLLGR